jgi:hypothetical protein
VAGADRAIRPWTPDLADVEVLHHGDTVEIVDRALEMWLVRFEPAPSSLPALGGVVREALAGAFRTVRRRRY